MAALSPASSPRLPSPPPIAEDQIGPTSPGISLHEEHRRFPGDTIIDVGAARRIRPGTKAEDMAEGPPLVDLQQIDSAFQLTEHLKALHFSQTHPDTNPPTTTPVTPAFARQLAQPPPHTSREIWLYELGRFLIQKTNAIIVGLFADGPPCSPATCPEMRASEWQYLCSVHDPPKNCSAIDYCCHTLDWAATSLTSSKMFPSRLDLGSNKAGGGSGGGSGGTSAGGSGGGAVDKVLQQQMKEITNIFRRVYRIYAHAWFQHREMFWRVEGKTGLYILFKTVCDEYGLIQPENYTIPQEAEGLESAEEETEGADATTKAPGPETSGPGVRSSIVPNVLRREPEEARTLPEPAGNTVLTRGDTTKRHRHAPSDLSNSVSAVIQEEAEGVEDATTKLVLDQESTAVHGSETQQALPETEEESSHEELRPTITRHDTLKPSSPGEESGAGEVTAVESEQLAVKTLPTEGRTEEVATTQDSGDAGAPAAEADEAAKSVED